jgi:hypothetical protein
MQVQQKMVLVSFMLSHPSQRARWMGHGGFKVQVQQCIIQTRQEMAKGSHGKDGKQRTFFTFPRHYYGYLFESVHGICCTWTLNVPTQIHTLWGGKAGG